MFFHFHVWRKKNTEKEKERGKIKKMWENSKFTVGVDSSMKEVNIKEIDLGKLKIYTKRVEVIRQIHNGGPTRRVKNFMLNELIGNSSRVRVSRAWGVPRYIAVGFLLQRENKGFFWERWGRVSLQVQSRGARENVVSKVDSILSNYKGVPSHHKSGWPSGLRR